jgi:hypothetical protein
VYVLWFPQIPCQIAYVNALRTIPPSDKEHDGSSRNSHLHDPKGKKREQTA